MDNRIHNVINHIEENLDKAHTLHNLSKFAFLSPYQFHRTFKKATGYTPQKFIEKTKMAKAHELLTKSDISIQELAFQFGYKDYETFSRAFKRYYTFSPGDLKAITQKIMEQSNFDQMESHVHIFFPDRKNPMVSYEKIKQKMLEAGLDASMPLEVKPYLIESKTLNTSRVTPNLVKNKFILHPISGNWKQQLRKEILAHL